MFIEELSEFDIMDFGEVFGAYVVPEFNKDRTKIKAKFDFQNGKSAEFTLSDFGVKGFGFYASLMIGEVRRRWKDFMTEKFGEKYNEAYKQNNKKEYNNKNLLDLGN